MVGALRVDEPQEDGGAQRGARLAERRRYPVAGGARLGREDLGGDLLMMGWWGFEVCGGGCWVLGGK